MPDCSIIIINYNTFSLTADCIRSIKNKVTGNYSYEIIIVDNASEECDPVAFKTLFPEITLIASNINAGFAKGNNLGIAIAKGDYILLLNSDTLLLNDAVSIALRILKSDDRIGVLSAQLQFPDGELQAVAGVFPSVSRELKELFRITRFYKGEKKSRYYLGDLWDYNLPTEADWVWGAFFMFRKSDLRHFPNGKLHDNFFMYQEDVQWCYHFKKVLHKKICYEPEPKVLHFMGRSDPESSDLSKKYFSKILPNEYRWLCKTRGMLYAKLYYLLKSLYYFSLRRRVDIAKAKEFIRFVLK